MKSKPAGNLSLSAPMAGKQSGVSLIELVVFIVIISIAAVALLSSYRGAMPREGVTAMQMTQAAQLAQERMELILGQRIIQGYSSNTLDPCTVGVCPQTGQTGLFTVSVVGVNTSAVWPSGPSPTSYATYRMIGVTVTLGSTRVAGISTVLSNY